MAERKPSKKELILTVEELQIRLQEAEETLRAIREGEVDAIVVSGSQGEQVFSLFGAESIYRLIVETMKEAAFTVTFDGKILYCNAQFGEFLKKSTGQIVGHSLEEFVAEADKEAVSSMLISVRKESVRRRLVFRGSDGAVSPAHISGNLLNQPDQASICIVASDLTELENSTELIRQLRSHQISLHSANARFAAVLEQMSDCFAAFDREWHYTQVNPAAASAFHMTREQLLGKCLWEVWPLAYDLPIGVNFRRSVEERKPLHFECFYPAPLSRWFEYRCYPTEEGLATFFSDITDRRQTEDALRESEQRLRLLGNNLPDSAVYQYVRKDDAPGRFTYFSTGIEQLIGITVEDALRDAGTLHRLILPEYFEQLMKEEARSIHDLSDFNMDVPMRRPDGEVRWMRLRSRPRRMPDGSIVWDGVQMDITARKSADQRLKELTDTLERRVDERTFEAEYRARQLRQLAADLTLAEQRERQRLAMLLHDGLQQTLVAAKFSLALLEHGGDVQEKAAEVSSLIDDSIEISRSLTAELSPPILHKGGFVPALEWLAKWMHDKHGLTVKLASSETVHRTPEEISILLFQSVRELLFNVVKHSGVKQACVEITQADGQIQIDVADEGAGFNPRDLHSTEDNHTDMGLFSIRERLSYLGGTMEIESSPGKGSRFRLISPYDTKIEQSLEVGKGPKSDIPIAMASSGKLGSTAKIRVVLVDDHIVMRQGLAGLLEAEPDIKIVGEASDGESAVKLVRKIRPDIVLMDIGMPGVDGILATRIIHQEMPEIRIIGLSMLNEGEESAAIRKAGAVDYLTKTGPSDAVVEVIRKHAGKAPIGQDIRAN